MIIRVLLFCLFIVCCDLSYSQNQKCLISEVEGFDFKFEQELNFSTSNLYFYRMDYSLLEDSIPVYRLAKIDSLSLDSIDEKLTTIYNVNSNLNSSHSFMQAGPLSLHDRSFPSIYGVSNGVFRFEFYGSIKSIESCQICIKSGSTLALLFWFKELAVWSSW